jgi:hypothetical protein
MLGGNMKMISVSALVVAVGLGSAANACQDPPVGPPSIQIVQVSATTYCIWICNYSTAAALPGQFCTCAINKLGVIDNIKAVDVFLTSIDGTMPDPCNPGQFVIPLPGWSFNPNSNIGQTYQNQAGSGNWEGLLSATAQPIQPGRPITIKITLNVLPGVTSSDLSSAIDAGDPPFIGAGESNMDGTALVPGHFSLRSAGLIGVMGVPALGLAGLAVLGSGFAAAGIVAVRRRASVA